MVIRTRVLLKSLKLAVGLLICSAGVISTSWSQPPLAHMVVGRVQIPAVTEPLKLAEPNPISLQSNGQKVTSVMAGWGYYNAGGFVEYPFNENDDILPVSYDSSGSASVSVTPRRLGKTQLTLFVSFADGGVERTRINVQVVQPQRQPEKLVITFGGGDNRRDTPVLSPDLSEAHRTIDVFAAAIYKNLTNPVPLKASDVSFKLINSPGAAAEIDPSTGIVTARHVGQALLETSFGGVSTLTCIDVMNDVRMGPRSRCEELLPPGRRLPPSGMELDPTPPPQVRAGGPVGDEEHPARVASGVMVGQILHKEDPIYPDEAKQGGVSGYVVMNAKIDPKGQVVDLKVVSGPPMLRDSAVAAVKKWTYKPYLLNGRAVFVLTAVTVAFTITP
jgi:TonB family protein